MKPICNGRAVRIARMRQQLLLLCAVFVAAARIALDAQWIKLPTNGLLYGSLVLRLSA
jgi:hypothetical protein